MDQKQFILNEDKWKVILKLSLPAIIAMLLYGGNTLLDAFFVGRFVGEQALAGISLAYPLTQVALGFGSLIGVGAGSALSIAIGKKNIELQKRILGTVHYLTVFICLVYTILAFVFAEQFISAMGGDGIPLAYGVNYFKITAVGTFFWVLGLAYNMIIRAEGRMAAAARIMAYGLLVNAMFNYLFIVVFNLGVEGAAWATNIGMVVYSIAGALYFRGKASFKAELIAFNKHKEKIKAIISMGMPSFIMSIMSLLQAVVVFNALANYGSVADVAFFGVAYRIMTFAMTPLFGLMRALQPIIGINFGANQFDRVKSSFIATTLIGFLIMAPVWLVLLVFSKEVILVMLPSFNLLAQDILNFRVFISVLPLMPIVLMGLTFFSSIDKSKPASIVGISRQLVFYVPAMILLPKFFGVHWIYYGATSIDIITTLWIVMLIRSEFKLLKTDTQVMLA